MKLNTASMVAAAAVALSASVASAQSSSAQSSNAQSSNAQSSSVPSPSPTAAATLPDTFNTPQASSVQSVPAPATSNNAQTQLALREVILSIQGNQIDYTLFTDDLGAQLREQADEFGSLLSQFGALQTLTHQSQQDGAHLFEAQFENQKTEWIIGLADDGRVAVLLFRPAED